MISDKRTTDEWDAEVTWGKEIFGEDAPAESPDHTVVNITVHGTMLDDDALNLADWLIETIRGDSP
jgi:hypothetical protein